MGFWIGALAGTMAGVIAHAAAPEGGLAMWGWGLVAAGLYLLGLVDGKYLHD